MAGASVSLDADFSEVREVLGRIDPEGLDDARSVGLRAIGFRVVGVSRESYLSGPRPTRLDRQSGNLARSVIADEAELPEAISVGSDEIYAATHEFGATIRAVRAPRLVFGLGPNGGPPIRYAREVTIPARPFIGPAVEDVTPEMADLMAEAIEHQLEG